MFVSEVVVDFLQTGSGKTHTMMGEIKEAQGFLDEDSGITPRVFDYLFMRIKAV
jgi:kinesin family protein 15